MYCKETPSSTYEWKLSIFFRTIINLSTVSHCFTPLQEDNWEICQFYCQSGSFGDCKAWLVDKTQRWKLSSVDIVAIKVLRMRKFVVEFIPQGIHSKSEKVSGTAFSVKKIAKTFWVILGPFRVFLGHFGSHWAIFGPNCGKFAESSIFFAGSLGSRYSLLECMPQGVLALRQCWPILHQILHTKVGQIL